MSAALNAPLPDPAETLALKETILSTHHALLKRELPRLSLALVGKSPALVGTFGELRTILEAHLWKEEVVLFPAIEALARGEGGGGCGVEAPIRQMGFEHEQIRALEARLRRLSTEAGVEEQSLVELLGDLAIHATTEDERLFPAALALAATPGPPAASPDPEPPVEAPPPTRVTRSPEARAPGPFRLRHLGWSGLELHHGGLRLSIDPPDPAEGPILLSSTEQERVRGAAGSKGPFAAAPEVLRWLGLRGMPLSPGGASPFGGWSIAVRPYRPIPYATAHEAARKTLSALRSPLQAAGRLAFTLRRPESAPLAVRIDTGGHRVVLLGQALHRFLSPEEHLALVDWAGPADLIVAGTDYEDEAATGSLLAAFDAQERVIADLTGQLRRALGLPVRPLDRALAAAPRGTGRLEAGGRASA